MMPAAPFAERARIDAREKVLGAARYSADVRLPDLLYAMTVPATIAKGRAIDVPVGPALRLPGVVRVPTAADFPTPDPPLPASGLAPPPPTIMTDIAYRGAPVARLVAATLEAAIKGAEAIRPTYAKTAFAAVIGGASIKREPFAPRTAGDAERVLAEAPTTLNAHYVSPAQRGGDRRGRAGHRQCDLPRDRTPSASDALQDRTFVVTDGAPR
jgi:xanthine dehydrogenase YagR molybdenum-binding subunit